MNKRKKILVLTLIGIVFGMAGVYLGLSFYFQSHFFSNTRINGIDCGMQSVQKVKEKIQDRAHEYTITLIEREDQKEEITGAQLGMTYQDDHGVEALLEAQNGFAWPLSLGINKSYEMTANITYDSSVIDEILQGLDCFREEQIKEPVNARIGSNGTGYEIVPEVLGTTLRYEDVKEAVLDAADTGKTELDLEELGLYENPTVFQDDEALQAQMQELNVMISANIVYDFKDRQYTVDTAVIKEWITEGEDGSYALDESKVAQWVKDMAYNTDTFSLPRTFKTSLGPTIELPKYRGDYGWVIHKDKTTQALIEGLRNGVRETREPVYLYKGIERATNDIGGTYVEICISEQKMWCYKDGQLVVETPIISGNHSNGYDTPSGGVWAIDAKQRDRHFQRYNADVTFWLPFNDQIGIHDASWRSAAAYSKNTYLTGGSHGCINTPYDAAEKIFNTVDIGYPVVVYYSTDQVVGPEPTQQNGM